MAARDVHQVLQDAFLRMEQCLLGEPCGNDECAACFIGELIA